MQLIFSLKNTLYKIYNMNLTLGSLFLQVGGCGLLGDYPDLMESFNEFLLQAEKNGNIQTSDYFL